MAYMESITPGWDVAVVAALRCYAKARQAGRPILPAMIAAAPCHGMAAPVAVALSSVFELTEALLQRPIQAASHGDAPLQADEKAVLLMLEQGGALTPAQGSAEIPHGLPGVLVWAIRSARQLWSGRDGDVPPRAASLARHCPFPRGSEDGVAGADRFPVLR